MTTSINNRNSFIFYRSFFETIGDLNDVDQLEIYRAIAEYSLNDKSVNLTGFPKTIFRLIEPQLQANKRRFKNGCLGAEHGAKGGRPKSEKTPKKPLKNPKLTPNKNKNVNHNLNEESESEITIPSFIDASLWNSFLEMRKSKKAKPTPKAIELLVAKLTDFHKKGLDPNESLANSIESNWTGVFEPKPTQGKVLTKGDKNLESIFEDF
jgi:hypothetical protein